jgi:hypothetical protein
VSIGPAFGALSRRTDAVTDRDWQARLQAGDLNLNIGSGNSLTSRPCLELAETVCLNQWSALAMDEPVKWRHSPIGPTCCICVVSAAGAASGLALIRVPRVGA